MKEDEASPEVVDRADAVRDILRSRARIMARRIESQGSDDREMINFLSFRLGAGGLYGIALTSIDEILAVPDITRVPCVSKRFVGVANYRGELLSMVDVRPWFRVAPPGTDGIVPGSDARVVVIRDGKVSAGLLVDEIVGLAAYAKDSLADCAEAMEGNYGVVAGVHDGKVMILNVSPLLAEEE